MREIEFRGKAKGDVVEAEFNDDLYVVKWHSRYAMWVISDGILRYSFEGFYSDDVEIVGNVYDNPDLVEVER